MLFYLTTLGLQRYLEEEEPISSPGKEADVATWKHSDFLCINYILNCLDKVLYKVYQPLKTAKALWNALATKYKTQNISLKKFIVDKFMDYKMIDSKPVTAQLHELQIIIHELEAEGHKVGESFLVEAITGKLPPSWRDYRNYLKHKKKEISLQDLIVRLKIEADNRGITKQSEEAFVAEDSKTKNKKKNFQKKRKAPDNKPKDNKRTKKFNGECWVCGKVGHAARDCRLKKDRNKEANLVDNMEVDESNFSAVVSECNMVQNPNQWWVDTGATRHVCSDKSMFSTYKKFDHEEKLYMGNSAVSMIEGSGTVILKFTSGKTVKLNNVLHVPDICKNLISGPVLSKKGFKMVFESDKMVLSKAGMYIGRGYLCDGLFKANVAVVGNKTMYSDYAIN